MHAKDLEKVVSAQGKGALQMAEQGQYNLWADGYGEQFHLLEDSDEYPYSGYRKLLNDVYGIVRAEGGKRILDVGFGTGILTRKLYEDGYEVTGIDLSERLVDAAKETMPKGEFLQFDITMGLPLTFLNREFDVVYSTYTFHHLDRYEKPRFINDLLRHLPDGGKVVIGDLAFETLKQVKQFRKEHKDAWQKNDMYLVFEEVRKDFPNAVFQKVSDFAGYVVITKE